MFFKVLYYLLGIIVVIYKLGRFYNTNDTKEIWKLSRWYDDAKANKTIPKTTDGWKEKLGEQYSTIILMLMFSFIELLFILVGLFTYNWLIFLSLIIYSLISNGFLDKFYKINESTFLFSTQFNLMLYILAYLFAIVNTFHLHINLFNIIFGG